MRVAIGFVCGLAFMHAIWIYGTSKYKRIVKPVFIEQLENIACPKGFVGEVRAPGLHERIRLCVRG